MFKQIKTIKVHVFFFIFNFYFFRKIYSFLKINIINKFIIIKYLMHQIYRLANYKQNKK